MHEWRKITASFLWPETAVVSVWLFSLHEGSCYMFVSLANFIYKMAAILKFHIQIKTLSRFQCNLICLKSLPNLQPSSSFDSFENGGLLKILNSFKTRIYEPIWTKLDTYIVLARSRPNFDDQLCPSSSF